MGRLRCPRSALHPVGVCVLSGDLGLVLVRGEGPHVQMRLEGNEGCVAAAGGLSQVPGTDSDPHSFGASGNAVTHFKCVAQRLSSCAFGSSSPHPAVLPLMRLWLHRSPLSPKQPSRKKDRGER